MCVCVCVYVCHMCASKGLKRVSDSLKLELRDVVVYVSANTRACRVRICMRQEGNVVQHDSVASVGSNFQGLTLGGLF